MFYICGRAWRQAFRSQTNTTSRIFQHLRRFEESDSADHSKVLFVTVTDESLREFWKVVKPHHTRVFVGAEAEFPNLNIFDFSIGFDNLNFRGRHIRIHPSYHFENVFPPGWVSAKSTVTGANGFRQRQFCDFIYSNSRAHPMRDTLFFELSKIRTVDSLGKHDPLRRRSLASFLPRNTGPLRAMMEEKVQLQMGYRFSIVAENAHFAGYTSEKILSSLLAGQVPIYWGNPDITEDFNPRRFIRVEDFASLKSLRSYVEEIDADEKSWEKMVSEDWYSDANESILQDSASRFDCFLDEVFGSTSSAYPKRGIGTFPTVVEARARKSRPGWSIHFRENVRVALKFVLYRSQRFSKGGKQSG